MLVAAGAFCLLNITYWFAHSAFCIAGNGTSKLQGDPSGAHHHHHHNSTAGHNHKHQQGWQPPLPSGGGPTSGSTRMHTHHHHHHHHHSQHPEGSNGHGNGASGIGAVTRYRDQDEGRSSSDLDGPPAAGPVSHNPHAHNTVDTSALQAMVASLQAQAGLVNPFLLQQAYGAVAATAQNIMAGLTSRTLGLQHQQQQHHQQQQQVPNASGLGLPGFNGYNALGGGLGGLAATAQLPASYHVAAAAAAGKIAPPANPLLPQFTTPAQAAGLAAVAGNLNGFGGYGGAMFNTYNQLAAAKANQTQASGLITGLDQSPMHASSYGQLQSLGRQLATASSGYAPQDGMMLSAGRLPSSSQCGIPLVPATAHTTTVSAGGGGGDIGQLQLPRRGDSEGAPVGTRLALGHDNSMLPCKKRSM